MVRNLPVNILRNTWRKTEAEGRNWKSEMDKFLMMYRSTPHSTTGVSPAELLFRTRIRAKLPHLQPFSIEDEVRDRDSERKEKGMCMQTAKGMQVKARFEKVIRCYLGRRKRTNCQGHTNSLPLQLFRRMAIVFLLRLMVCSAAGM